MRTPLTRAQMANLLTSAFEGGSNYWYQIDGYKEPAKLGFLSDAEFAKVMNREPQVFKHADYPLNPGGAVIVRDADEGKTFTLDLEACRRGAQVMRRSYPRHYAAVIAENDDAETGDVFLQCCLFGEVIYG